MPNEWLAVTLVLWAVAGAVGARLSVLWTCLGLDLQYPQYGPHRFNDPFLLGITAIMGPVALAIGIALFLFNPPRLRDGVEYSTRHRYGVK